VLSPSHHKIFVALAPVTVCFTSEIVGRACPPTGCGTVISMLETVCACPSFAVWNVRVIKQFLLFVPSIIIKLAGSPFTDAVTLSANTYPFFASYSICAIYFVSYSAKPLTPTPPCFIHSIIPVAFDRDGTSLGNGCPPTGRSMFMSIELIVFAGSGSVAGKSTFVINNLPLLSSKEPLSLSFIVTCTGGAN